MNLVSTLALVSPGVVVPQLVSYVQTQLDQPSFLQVTHDDYGIFLTPDGELYDKAILDRWNILHYKESSANYRKRCMENMGILQI